jgi:hypothetical protein
MDRRLSLQTLLKSICANVYFQAPSNVQMLYPAIVYGRGRAETKFADNRPYSHSKNYSLTLISRNPDEAIFEALAALPMCAHETHYVAENLNHDVFSIYF